jgi:hypothetical protein
MPTCPHAHMPRPSRPVCFNIWRSTNREAFYYVIFSTLLLHPACKAQWLVLEHLSLCSFGNLRGYEIYLVLSPVCTVVMAVFPVIVCWNAHAQSYMIHNYVGCIKTELPSWVLALF